MNLDGVRKLALAMPGVVETTSYGNPAFKVAGKLLARLFEDDVLAVHAAEDAKDALIDSQPRVFFTIPHDHETVLVRLSRVKPGVLRDTLFDAYRVIAPEKGVRAKVRAALLAIEGVEEHLSQFGGRRAYWIGGREFAHFHDGNVIELRGAREWTMHEFASARDVARIAQLAAESVAANAAAGRTLKRPRGRRH
jgi:hypothetical protein